MRGETCGFNNSELTKYRFVSSTNSDIFKLQEKSDSDSVHKEYWSLKSMSSDSSSSSFLGKKLYYAYCMVVKCDL